LATLKENLVQISQREDSGARTNARYHYQALCGLILVLEEHKKSSEFALVFEFHDDIALLNSPQAPTKVRFYQVKSKQTGSWTSATLTNQPTKKGTKAHSHLGKIYENVLNFGDQVESATFLSNASINFAPADKTKFCLDECDSKTLQAISANLSAEFLAEDTIKTELIWLEQTDLSLSDTDNHAKGKLETFIVESLGQTVEFSLDALFKAVSEECDRKSREKKVDLSNFSDVVEKRGITKANAQAWIDSVSLTVNCPSWEAIAPDIQMGALPKKRLMREYKAYRIEVLNPNEAVRKARRIIARCLSENDWDELSLNELVQNAYALVHAEIKSELLTATEERIKAMIIYETYSIN